MLKKKIELSFSVNWSHVVPKTNETEIIAFMKFHEKINFCKRENYLAELLEDKKIMNK